MMKTMSFLMGALVGLSLVVTSCGKMPPSGAGIFVRRTTFPPSALTADKLLGTWNSECYQVSNISKQDKWIIGGSFISVRTFVFSDKSCASLYSSLESQSIYALKDGVATQNYSTVAVTSFSANAVSTFNSTAKCGSSGWQLGEQKTFPDSKLCGIPQIQTSTLALYGSTDLFIKDCDPAFIPTICTERKFVKQ